MKPYYGLIKLGPNTRLLSVSPIKLLISLTHRYPINILVGVPCNLEGWSTHSINGPIVVNKYDMAHIPLFKIKITDQSNE